jgi:DNA-binding transcriptional ArsR family regulator
MLIESTWRTAMTQQAAASASVVNAAATAAVLALVVIIAATVNQMANLDQAFAAYAHPIRRGIIERLAEREMTVAEATSDFGVSKPAISRHLRVLEEAGAIVRVIDGRQHRLRLREDALDDPYHWLDDLRAMWEHKFDTVEQYLAEQRR